MRVKAHIVLSAMVLLLVTISISSADMTQSDMATTTDTSLIGDVSGLGWIMSPTPTLFSNKAGFAFTVYNGSKVRGVLSYVDYPARLFVLGNVTTLSIDRTTNTATFSGTAKISNRTGTRIGTYSVIVEDKAKPGKGNDTFAITLSTGYTASGVLQGGDIVIKP